VTPRHLLIALGAVLGTAPALAQPKDMAPVTCFTADEARRFSEELTVVLKKEGLIDEKGLTKEIQGLMNDALDKRAKADACAEKAGDAADKKCRAENTAADQAEANLEGLNARMEKIEQSMLAVRARYRRC
jgi:hypothetical protein